MNQSQQAQLDALRDAQRFLDSEPTALASVNRTLTRKALDDVITELETQGTLQVQSTTDALNGTTRKDELRVELREHHMQLLVEIARTKLAHSPLISRFRVPRVRASDTSLITAALAIVNAAELTPATFAGDLGPDFAAQLRTRIDDFRDAVINRNHSQVSAKQATRSVKDALVTARGIVRILDCIVRRETKDSPALRVGWQAAKHVKAKGGVPQGTVREVPAMSLAPVVTVDPVVPTSPTTPAVVVRTALLDALVRWVRFHPLSPLPKPRNHIVRELRYGVPQLECGKPVIRDCLHAERSLRGVSHGRALTNRTDQHRENAGGDKPLRVVMRQLRAVSAEIIAVLERKLVEQPARGRAHNSAAIF
jgi:hypothetical protein